MNALITGTSSGIGRALAARMVADGDRVWGVARREPERQALQRQLGSRFLYSTANVAVFDDVRRVLAQLDAGTVLGRSVLSGRVTRPSVRGPVGTGSRRSRDRLRADSGGQLSTGQQRQDPEIVGGIAATNPCIKVVAQVKEGMMGWDLRTGLEAATGRHLAVIDGDGQMPSSDIVKVYRMLQVGGYHIVKTFHAQRFDGLYRATISRVYNLLFRLLFRNAAKFRDINSNPKVMTREAYGRMNLVSNDWFTDAEIMIEAIRNRLQVG